jgi:glycosyltransferase involved in cell wall biosynthesis
MKIMVLGIRGFPKVQGGVETHAEQLYPRLVREGCSVEVIVRASWTSRLLRTHEGVSLTRLWAPRLRGTEAFIHSLIGVFYAAWRRPDILHIHAIGPAIFTPLARCFGLRVVVTHHGQDNERDKWGRFARSVLRLGERWGMCCSQARIGISRVIVERVRRLYGLPMYLIPNGVPPPVFPPTVTQLERFGLQPGRYVLQVSRLVPEKRQLDLIDAFRAARLPPPWTLVLVGGGDSSEYCRELGTRAAGGDVRMTGFLSGEPLRELYANAGLFVLPSSHEGLPIALLEALSYGLPVVASDIPANLEVGLPANCYFPVGNSAELSRRLQAAVSGTRDRAACAALRERVLNHYDWNDVARRTLDVYRRICDA